ncbi:MAG TPA: hypothetical protein VKZ43_03670, partial [Trueperaceae bacterium]|nr:hypothetical protein [Trueperaceae bacterium]
LDALPEAVPVPVTTALELPIMSLDAAATLAVRQGKRPPLPVVSRTALVDEAEALVAVVEPVAGEEGYTILRVFN